MLWFPKVEDVPLESPPLVEVVCQVRFPAILSIASETPAKFQERIREKFPLFEIEQGVRIEMPSPGSSSAPHITPATNMYRFRSSDGDSQVSLAADFYAVSTSAYRGWPEFADALSLATHAAQEVYRPSHASRIGLRYVNQLTCENTGSRSAEELVQFPREELTSLLRSSAWSLPERMVTELLLSSDEGNGKLKLRVAFTQADESPVLVLDFDYYQEGRLGMNDVMTRAEAYHDTIYRAFRWSISNDALNVFDPVSGRVVS